MYEEDLFEMNYYQLLVANHSHKHRMYLHHKTNVRCLEPYYLTVCTNTVCTNTA